jgi:hypothetical protein
MIYIFSIQKLPIWVNFEDVGTLYGHLVYFTAIWYIIWPFGIFFMCWYFVPRKIWQPCDWVIVYFWQFFENYGISRIFWLLFSMQIFLLFLTKVGLAIFWAIFFTNSSGHPGFETREK